MIDQRTDYIFKNILDRLDMLITRTTTLNNEIVFLKERINQMGLRDIKNKNAEFDHGHLSKMVKMFLDEEY